MTPRAHLPRSDRSRLAPSIRKAHRRVLIAAIASGPHAALLLVIGLLLLLGEESRWLLGPMSLGGALAVPLLARASYKGNSFAALLLLLSALIPLTVAWLADADVTIPLLFLAFAPFYFLGARGAIGLRGRRGSRRG